jgi:Tfp pilus assembly protein PilX
MRRAELRTRLRAGFATATVLGLVAVVALLCTGALHDALFGNQLAASRLLHQRAAALAEQGLRAGLEHLAALAPPQDAAFAFEPLAASTDNVTVSIRHRATGAFAPGYSGKHIATHHYEIESTAHVARGVRATRVQGAWRALPIPATPAPEASP